MHFSKSQAFGSNSANMATNDTDMGKKDFVYIESTKH